MKRIPLLTAVLSMFFIIGCTSYKDVPYLQNSDYVDLSGSIGLYDAKIMPKDILTITVNCPDEPQAVAIYNLAIQSNNMTNSTSPDPSRLSSQVALQSYLVSNDGYIDFPVLGKLKVLGMTKTELESSIEKAIMAKDLKIKPIVIVTMANYKVAVMGEVARPGIYTIANGKVNIFEALAMGGDMTIYGMRNCVKVIRENALGEKTIAELDLNDANVIKSPYYQLQQNDIVYVIPNKTKAKNSGIGQETSLWFTSTSILVSMASLLYNILK
ncbi:MAG: polysaccharide biosynthesis/export family protein [Bacteroides sp.]|nr:polysaccharide biosynthesis/export family protein [Roseburia sp.]MCM1346899.1 polysaccharide biosynthesis/export family protein [Bacteroides sp.]MCM1420622.1 polysaccharide biosynthesis/export family protein [Bacteroides sp.]